MVGLVFRLANSCEGARPVVMEITVEPSERCHPRPVQSASWSDYSAKTYRRRISACTRLWLWAPPRET